MHFFLFFLFLVNSAYGTSWKEVFLPSFSKIQGVNAQCANDTETWQNSMKLVAEVSVECLMEKRCSKEEEKIIEENFYAVEQYDAWGKFPLTGLFQGSILWEGSYQECERISGVKYETNYCYMVLFPGKNATCHMSNGEPTSLFIRGAVCLPYSCSEADLPTVYNQISNQPFTACGAYCSKFPVKKTPAFWTFTAFLGVMTVIVLAATVIDYLRDAKDAKDVRKDSKIMQMLMAFSMWTNAEVLLSVKEHKPGFIKCLDCIRFLSMLWVVTGHTFTYLMIPDQILAVLPFTGKFWNHFILNAFYSVDTFFLLSGIVVAYLFFKTRLKIAQIKSPMTWILYYIHRYLRLTPPVMIFIGFFVVYGYYIQGPGVASQINQLVPQVDVCSEYWWRNLLYINNLGSDVNQCYGITWYLGVDTQLYIIAPVFLVALYFSFAAGTALLMAATVGSVITVYILYSVNDLPADFFGNGDNTNFYDIIYDKPWVRGTPYFIGLYVGYLLATYGKRKFRLNWALSVTGWMIAFALVVFCLFSTYDYDKRVYWSVFIRASYYNFSRLAWSLAVSWAIIANHMGWGGPIDAFMSHPMWQPFGRLSYCAYIVHYVVLYLYLSIGDVSIHFYSTFQIFIYYSVPTTLLSYIFAFFWSCFFEIPFLKLEKMLIETIISTKKVDDIKKPSAPIPKTELWDAGEETQRV
uniref:NRF domain-containing protein n=1 Tax=Caenorhabditis tropicalis TaxID=1561998 RepID=A0A1I7UTZ5_9PELO